MDPLIPCGQAAPDFELPDLDGAPRRLSELRGRIALLNFWSAECPWAAHADEQLQGYLERWKEQVVLWTIAANANEPLDLVKQVAKNAAWQWCCKTTSARQPTVSAPKPHPTCFWWTGGVSCVTRARSITALSAKNTPRSSTRATPSRRCWRAPRLIPLQHRPTAACLCATAKQRSANVCKIG